MRLSRRAVLLGALASAGAAGGIGAGCTDSGPGRTIQIASGEPEGLYTQFADKLAAQLTDAGRPLRAKRSTMPSRGSVDNIDQVVAGQADLGLALVDTAQAARDGTDPFSGPVRLAALGRVYENYMQLVVRRDDPVPAVSFESLAGRPVSLGAGGSGTAAFGARLSEITQVAVDARNYSLDDAVYQLVHGGIDALLWSGGLPTKALDDASRTVGIRLLDLAGYVDRLNAAFSTRSGDLHTLYSTVTVPVGTYGAPTEVRTVGVPNLLVASPGLDDAVVRTTVGVLVRRAGRLVPDQALGTQYLDIHSLIDTSPVELHPAAAVAYRKLRE